MSPRSVPYFRMAGNGDPVICLHAGFSSGTQWRPLMSLLAPSFRTIAADLYGCGRSPLWPEDDRAMLEDEVRFLEPLFDVAGGPFHLIGHSFGGAVAMKAALMHGDMIRSLTLFEPVLFSFLADHDPNGPDLSEIVRHRDEVIGLTEQGDGDEAAEVFVDYWFFPGAWRAMPPDTRADISRRMGTGLVGRGWHQLFSEPGPAGKLAAITAPVLYLTAAETNRPTGALSRLCIASLTDVRSIDIKGAGHMAPLTHPDLVNPAIESFLLPFRQEGQ